MSASELEQKAGQPGLFGGREEFGEVEVVTLNLSDFSTQF